MNKTHKLKVRTARSCWKLLERCCPTSKVKGVRYDGLSPPYQSFGSNFVKSWLKVGPVEELRWTNASPSPSQN